MPLTMPSSQLNHETSMAQLTKLMQLMASPHVLAVMPEHFVLCMLGSTRTLMRA